MFSKRYDSDEGPHQKVEEKSGAGKEVDDNKVWFHFDIDAPLDEDSLLGDDFMNGGCMPCLAAIQKRCLPSSSNQRYNPEKKRLLSSSSQGTFRPLAPTYTEFAKECARQHTERHPDIDVSEILTSDDFEDLYQHCKSKIGLELAPGYVYIGITSDPEFRWENEAFGHKFNKQHKFEKMVVLVRACCEWTRAIEISLVKHFKVGRWGEQLINSEHSPPGALREKTEGEHFLYYLV